MTKMILWLSMIWLPAVMCLIQINEAKFKKNITVGVTLPEEAKNDPGVAEILAAYKKQTILAAAAATALGVCGLFIDTPYMMTVYMTWVLFAVIFPMIPFVLTNMKLKDYKAEKGWRQAQRNVYVDTAALEQTRLLSPWLFVPPVIICLIPLIWERGLAVFYVLFALICASMWLGSRYLYRSKAEMFNENTDLTNALSRMRRYNWQKMWLLLSWVLSFGTLAASVPAKYQLYAMSAFYGLMILLMIYVMRLEFKTRRIQERLTEKSGSDFYVDEDDHWLLGMFYYNPDDSSLIINNRTGLNSTVNMARPAGKVLMVIALLLVAALPFIGLFVDSLGQQPVELSVNETQLISKCGMYHYEIELSEIENTEMLEKLPSALSRKMGSALDNLLEGRFTSEQYSPVKLLLDPNVSPYILVETKSGEYYIFNTREPAQTERIFEELNH